MALGNLINGNEGTLKRDPPTGHLRFKGATDYAPFANCMRRTGTFNGPTRYTFNDAIADKNAVQQGAVNALSAWANNNATKVRAHTSTKLTHMYSSGGIGVPAIHTYWLSATCWYDSALLTFPSTPAYKPIVGVSFTVTDYLKQSPFPTYYVSATAVATTPTDRGTTFAWAIGTYNVQVTGNGVYEVRNRTETTQTGGFPPVAWTKYGWGVAGAWYLILCVFINDLTLPNPPESLGGSMVVTKVNQFSVVSPSLIYKG